MTIRLFGKTTGGKQLELSSPLDLRYEADRFIPCDSLDFSVPLQQEGQDFCEVEAQLDGILLFQGIVDRQISEKSESGHLLRLECRSRTALLLDNEVKPYIYFQLTSDQLLSRYALPFGVAGAKFPFPGKRSLLQVKKGMSNWAVIEEFCLLVYRSLPYLNRSGILTLNPLGQTVHLLSNRALGGKRYSSLAIHRRRDKLISRLYVKTATESNGYYYGMVIDNPYASSQRVRRERYYHPQYKIASEVADEVKRIVDESNRDGLTAEVMLPGFLHAEIGDQVRLPDEALPASLLIRGISYRMSASGIFTRLSLMDKAFV